MIIVNIIETIGEVRKDVTETQRRLGVKSGESQVSGFISAVTCQFVD